MNACTLHQLIIFHNVWKLCRLIGPGWLIIGTGFSRLTLYDFFFNIFLVLLLLLLLFLLCV